MKNGKCKYHGGKSTGPKTAKGLDRIRAARTRHGLYGVEGVKLRTIVRLLKDGARKLTEAT